MKKYMKGLVEIALFAGIGVVECMELPLPTRRMDKMPYGSSVSLNVVAPSSKATVMPFASGLDISSFGAIGGLYNPYRDQSVPLLPAREVPLSVATAVSSIHVGSTTSSPSLISSAAPISSSSIVERHKCLL